MPEAVTAVSPCYVAAITYLQRGWSPLCLLPPHLNGEAGKRPIGDWEEYQHRLPSPDELKAWWLQYPTGNVGVAMGPVSGLVGIDVDGYAGLAKLDELTRGDLPATLQFSTGRDDSFRWLYGLPADCPCPPVQFRDDTGGVPVTILGHGLQSVMPPSRYFSGRQAEWCFGRSPQDLEVALAPKWLEELLRFRGQAADRQSQPFGDRGARGLSGERGLGDHLRKVATGGRNVYLTKALGALRRNGAEESALLAAARVMNAEQFDEPLEDREVCQIVRSVSGYAPAVVPSESQLSVIAPPERKPVTGKPMAVRLVDVKPRPIHWLWPGWLPVGCLVALDGDGGVGKGHTTYDIAARLTRGDPMPDGSEPVGIDGPQGVLVVACEDDLASVVRPRLEAAGADLSRITYLEEVTEPDGSRRLVQLPDDMKLFESVVETANPRFVLIDPINSFLSGVDINNDNSVRRILGQLKVLAERRQMTIVFVRHLNKATQQTKAAYRGIGSVAFRSAARAAITFGHHPEESDVSVMALEKSNFGSSKPSLKFRLVPVGGTDVCRVEWLGVCALTADQVASAVRPPSAGLVSACCEHMQQALAAGPELAAAVRLGAKNLGFDDETVNRAKAKLGVKSSQDSGRGDQWVWSLT